MPKSPHSIRAVIAISVVVLVAGSIRADEPASQAEWLSLDKNGAPGSILVEVGDADATGQSVVVALPGVWKSPVQGADGQAYVQLSAPGCGVTADKPGMPALPFKGIFLEVPHGVDVSVTLAEPIAGSLGAGHRVHPYQPPEQDDGSEPQPFQLDANVYATNAFLPSSPVVADEPGLIRGRRVVFVKVFPLQYNPATGELRGFGELEIRVSYGGPADPMGKIRKSRLATESSEATARDLIANYQPTEPQPAGGEPDGGDGADYLIIVADNLYDEVLPLAEWKHRKGFLTRVVKMSEIGATSNDVKTAIQTAYDTWTPAPSYVLLVGDNGDVPANYFYGTLECTSDHPYACVDGTDFYPDVTLGRLPVGTPAECSTVVDKILAYERTPDVGTWCGSFLSAGYFQDDDNDARADRWFMETSMNITEFIRDTVGMTTYTAWCTNSGAHDEYHYRSLSYPHRFTYPDPVPSWVVTSWKSAYVARTDVTSAINAGISLLIHRDHGGQTGWGDPPFGNTQISGLTNGAKLPVVFSINCQTGSFQRSSGDCFCETFIKKTDGGAVGIMGATRDSYSGYNDLLANGIVTSFWPSYDTSHTNTTYSHSWRPAEAMNYGKYYMLVYRGTGNYTEGEFHMFHWFGDPEMSLRTESPRALTVNHPSTAVSSVPIDVMISVLRQGSPLEGARATISRNDTDEHWTALTDGSGTVTFSDAIFSEGDYDLVVTSRNALPYEGTIVAGPDSAGSIALDNDAYSCAGTIGIHVVDSDLSGNGTQDVTVTTSGGDSETVALAETESNTGVFDGTVSTGDGLPTAEDGTVQVAHGQTITATYQDADNGQGQPSTVQDTASADCLPPTISNVQVIETHGQWVAVSFETDVPCTGRVRCGETCGGPYTATGEDQALSTTHTVQVSDLEDESSYVFVVDAWDAVGNQTTDDNSGACYTFDTPYQPDYFSELFDADDNDLSYHSLEFTPDGSDDHYSACWEPASAYHTDPNGGTVLSLADNDAKLIILTDGKVVPCYGMSAGGFYLGSNGYLTAPTADYNPNETMADHFSKIRIAALFDDLDPAEGGTVSWKQTEDRLAVTYDNVPEHGKSNSNSFQIEAFFDGTIRLTWLQIDATDGLVGLSRGEGLPSDLVESDLSAYASCSPMYELRLGIRNMMNVELSPEPDDPNQPMYPENTVVTLTIAPGDESYVFVQWEIHDMNHIGDANYVIVDTNQVTTVVMDRNLYVDGKFKCGESDAFTLTPLALLMTLMFVRRRQ